MDYLSEPFISIITLRVIHAILRTDKKNPDKPVLTGYYYTWFKTNQLCLRPQRGTRGPFVPHTHTNINWKGGEIQKVEREGLEWEQSLFKFFWNLIKTSLHASGNIFVSHTVSRFV